MRLSETDAIAIPTNWQQGLDSSLTGEAVAIQESSQSITSSIVNDERLSLVDRDVEVLFRTARDEIFKDGVESEFERRLVLLVRAYSSPAVDTIGHLIDSGQVNMEAASVALRALGEMYHPESYSRRLQLLEKSLRSSSYWVRDGATLGLAWSDDPIAIPALVRSAEREPIEELRQDMEAVIGQLKATRQCRSSSGV